MGAKNVGIYSYAYSVASYFGLFILLGLNNYGNRTIAQVRDDKEKLSKTFSSIYAMQLIMGVLVILLYVLYIVFISSNKMMAGILLIYLISVAIDINWFYFGIEQFKLTVTRNTIIKILNTILLFIFVNSKDDIYIYALLLVVGMLVSQLILWGMIKNYVRFKKTHLSEIVSHIKPNLVLFIPVIAISIYNTMDKIMLGLMSNMTQVGYYESAFKLTTIPVMAITSLGTVMLPRISNIVANGNNSLAKSYIHKSLILSLFLAAPVSLGLSAVVNEFVPLFYGQGYDTCKYLIPVLVTASIFISWANVIRTQYLIPNSQDKIYIISVFLGAVVNLIINILLIPMYQSFGAAIGTLFAEITVCLYQSFKVRKEIKIYKYFAHSFPFVIFAIIMYMLLIFVPYTHSLLITLFIKVLLGSLLYISLALIYYKKVLLRVIRNIKE